MKKLMQISIAQSRMNCEKVFMPVRFRKHTEDIISDVKVEEVRRKVRDEEEKSEAEKTIYRSSGRDIGTGKGRLFCQGSGKKPGVLSGG